jgi:hypothetical protein
MARPLGSASNSARATASKARRPSSRARGALATPPRKGEPPDFRISVLEVRGRPSRILLDVETNPPLTPFENQLKVPVRAGERLFAEGRQE